MRDYPRKENFIETEICVIGGGVAGVTTAHQLSLLGYQVLLVERSSFARQMVAESLPISILPLLDILSVRRQVEKTAFINQLPPIMRWRASDNQLDSQPNRKPQESVKPSLQIDRGQFDQILLGAAKQVGVKLLRGTNVRKPSFEVSSGIWTIPVISKRESLSIKASFLIDASGKHSVLSAKKQAYSATTLALSGCWQSNLSLASRIEAGQAEWYWGGALPDEGYNITVFIDKEKFLVEKKHSWIHLYKTLIAKSELFTEFLKGELISPPSFRDATAYFDIDIVGTNYIKVGEAAFSIEPISSQGVALAISSALQASVVVNTLKKRIQNSKLAIDFYTARQQETVTRSQKTAATFYQEARYQESSFWKKRASLATENNKNTVSGVENNKIIDSGYKICLSKEAKIINTPTIDKAFIVATPALSHPLLDRPVAYFNNVAIVPLLKEISPTQTVMEIILKWSKFLPIEACWAVIEWLWKKEIVVSVN